MTVGIGKGEAGLCGVQALEDLARGLLGAVYREGAEHVAQFAHAGGGLDVVAGDVPDDECKVSAGEGEGVVPVASDLGGPLGRLVVGGQLHTVHARQGGEQGALEGGGDVGLGGMEVGVLQPERGTTGNFFGQDPVALVERGAARCPDQSEGAQRAGT
ncbi:hypothetical protein GCM10010336_69350 [Streptomyces goshikiensis]|nr:hypothetical protein [Streptomyces goshikiensis]GHD82241.1 hypothetical protein GCM10010336_69350 [Streptomyces goshikiensis]